MKKNSLEKLKRMLNGTIETIALVGEIRDRYTAGHQQRVAKLALAIGREIGLSDEQVEGVRVAGFLHDIGKIAIPAEILAKPGKISDCEFNLIKTHPQVGFDILKRIEFPWPTAEAVLQHHERLDGSGYPGRLPGDKIILEARILAVADVVEAMSSYRPYRLAPGMGEALKEIADNKGVIYDSRVADACLRLFSEKGFTFN